MYGNPERIIPVSSHQLHDVKNRLTVIKGVAQLLHRQVSRADWEQPRVQARVERLQQEVLELEHLIAGLSHPAPSPPQGTHTDQPVQYTDGE